MIVRYNTSSCLQPILLSIAALVMIGRTPISLALPIMKDSPIQTIIVPYQPNTASGHTSQFPKLMNESRQVLVPAKMKVVPRFNLNQGAMAMGSLNGAPLNFADGAYPVYYMPSNSNGKFNGKISLLDGVLKP